jgi:WD40 repeat protein
MKFNHVYLLEISETIALFFLGLGAIITLVSNNLFFLVLPIVVVLILNQINRREKERQIYHKTLGKLEHLQNQVWHELQSLNQLIESLQDKEYTPKESRKKELTNLEENPLKSSQENQIYTKETIEDYQEYIFSLEESLNHVIQYLNQAGINQRFQQLEEYYEQVTNDVVHLTRKLNYTSELVADKQHSSPLLLFGQDNPVAKTSEEINNSKNQEDQKTLELSDLSEIILPNKSPSFNTKWVKIHEFLAHENGVTDLTISPDSYFVASVSLDQNLKIWALETGKLLQGNIAHEKGILALTCKQLKNESQEFFNYILATGGFDYNIKLWEFTTNKKELFKINSNHTLTGHLGSIWALNITPDGQILVSGSYDKTVKQWTIKDGQLIQNSLDHLSSIQSLAISYDGQIIASGDEDGKIYFWERETGVKRGSLKENENSIKSIDFSENGQLLGAGCSDGTVKLWKLEPSIFTQGNQPDPTSKLSHHQGEITSVIFSPCGKYIISGDIYGKILISSLSSGEIMETLHITQESENEQTRLLSLALSDNGNFLVAGDVKGNITIWRNHSS